MLYKILYNYFWGALIRFFIIGALSLNQGFTFLIKCFAIIGGAVITLIL